VIGCPVLRGEEDEEPLECGSGKNVRQEVVTADINVIWESF
jgi:hypothetical protein